MVSFSQRSEDRLFACRAAGSPSVTSPMVSEILTVDALLAEAKTPLALALMAVFAQFPFFHHFRLRPFSFNLRVSRKPRGALPASVYGFADEATSFDRRLPFWRARMPRLAHGIDLAFTERRQ